MKSDLLLCITGAMVFVAAALSIGSVSWCETVDFTLQGVQEREVSFGLWRYNSFVLVGTSDGGIWKLETCVSYPDEIEEDSYWQAAKAFSIIAPIWGTFSWCPLLLAGKNPSMAKIAGALLMLATLFQGLSLLIFKSDICDAGKNPLFNETSGASTTKSQCDLGRSAAVSISATCLWFVAGAVALVVPVEEREE